MNSRSEVFQRYIPVKTLVETQQLQDGTWVASYGSIIEVGGIESHALSLMALT